MQNVKIKITDTIRLDFLQRTGSLVNLNGSGYHLAYYPGTNENPDACIVSEHIRHFYGASYRDVIDLAIRQIDVPLHAEQIITISREAIRSAGPHNDCNHCLLGTELSLRGFKGVAIRHEGAITSIGKFRFSKADEQKLRNTYPQMTGKNPAKYPKGRGPKEGAKPRKSTKPFSITLIPIADNELD